MRIRVVYAIISAAFLLGSLQDGYGQTLEETFISTSAETKDLKSVLDQITRETGFLFTYPENMVREVKRVTVPAGTRSVSAMLDLVLRNTGLRYWQSNRMVAIFKDLEKDQLEEDEGAKRVYTVQGRVLDNEGKPLPGATVVVKGDGTYTATDADGRFSVKATAFDVLAVTLMYHKTKEVPIGGKALIDISLDEEVEVLHEVEVFAGYWSVKERENTGNISLIKEETLRRQLSTNPVGLLSGQTPGVFVQQRSGLPGSGYDLTIRGRTSLRSEGNFPLYLVDGVPFPAASISSQAVAGDAVAFSSPLNNINASDIERIEILKDADATAIYGSRGANGVILITTRRGKPGKTNVDVNVYQGTGQVTRTMSLLNTRQWVNMRTEAFKNDNIAIVPEHTEIRDGKPVLVFSNAPDLTEWDTTRSVDWQKQFIGGTARITQAQIAVNSGTEQTRFYFSGAFYKETTVFPGDFGMLRGSGHFNLNHHSTNDRFRLGFTASYVITNNELPNTDFTGAGLDLAPNAPNIYNDDGNINRTQPQYWFNPAMYLQRLYKGTTDNLMVSGYFGYSLLPGLVLKNTFGYTKLTAAEVGTTPISSQRGGTEGSSVHGNNAIHTWISEPQLEFERKIGDGKLSVLLGTTYQESILTQEAISAKGYKSDALIESLTSATILETVEDSYARYRYNAVFGRINYNWDGKYILNITGRRDGSSRFGPGNQYATFGAAGAAWIFSREQWIEDRWRWLSFGRLRASYGTTGSDQIGDYQFLDNYVNENDGRRYVGENPIVPSRLVNPSYSWEVNHKLEAALRLDVFRERLMVEASWYRNRSSNQLTGKAISKASGFPEMQWNSPVVVLNTGWEFLLNTVNISTDVFSWRSSANITFPKNELVSFPALADSEYSNTYMIGYPLSLLKTYRFTGVDPQTGLYTFEDVNNDGVIDGSDLQPSKRDISMYGGFQNTISYKAWELDVQLQWVKWNGENGLLAFFAAGGMPTGNQYAATMDRWQQPGDEASHQAVTTGLANSSDPAINSKILRNVRSFFNFRSSDQMISDASFLRLKNVSLSYHLQRGWVERLHLKQCKVYLQGQNLATWTGYIGSDPEIQNGRIAPPLRVVSLGIQLTL